MRVRASLAGEIIRMAVASIWAHKLRTFLTLLGIIIGVMSVLVVGAGLTGAQTYILKSVSDVLGSNAFILSQFNRFGNVSDDDWEKMVRRNPKVELEDLYYLRARCPDCSEISAELNNIQTTYSGSRELFGTSVRGVTSNYIYIATTQIDRGRFFTDQEDRSSRLVAVIGTEVAERLFPTSDPVGKTLKMSGQPLKVIGILEKQGSAFGQSQDNICYIPIETYRKIFGSRRSIVIRGKSVTREKFDDTLDQVRIAMRSRHQLRPGEEDDFGLISTEQINGVVDQFSAAVAGVIIPITAISLLVGGIVIMNIMLVSVSERTFEIGIRKALGARRKDILYQFLIESFTMAALGGLIGLALAALTAEGVEAAFEFPMVISWFYIMLSIGVSGGVGIVFGIYPAFQASKLDPIIAMSAER